MVMDAAAAVVDEAVAAAKAAGADKKWANRICQVLSFFFRTKGFITIDESG